MWYTYITPKFQSTCQNVFESVHFHLKKLLTGPKHNAKINLSHYFLLFLKRRKSKSNFKEKESTENRKIRRTQIEKCVYTICNTTHIASSKTIRVSNNNNNSNKQINKTNSNKFQ